MAETKPKQKTRDVTRCFSSWSWQKEERFLQRMARRGWHLYAVVQKNIYRFAYDTPCDAVYAVVYAGKTPDNPNEIAAHCNDGWTFAGRFGTRRYFYTAADGAESPPPHPSRNNALERERIRTVQSNLTTAALLNLPGTLCCIFYLAMLLFDGGFTFAEIFTLSADDGVLYIAGIALGLSAIYYCLRKIICLHRRIRFLGKERQRAAEPETA